MIKNIKLKNTPPYLRGEQIINPNRINFIYGSNGTGKTTISRFLSTPNSPKYNDCCLEWDGDSIPCEVYNSDYIEKNFSQSSIPGIFTLGEQNIKIKKQIEEYTSKNKELSKQCSDLEKQLTSDSGQGLEQELKNHEQSYTEKFWKIKQHLDKENSPMQQAIAGTRGSKDQFKSKLLSEYASNTNELLNKTELETLCQQVYGKNIETLQSLNIPNFDALNDLEASEVLTKIIIGSTDIDISRLIKKLDNESWVRQGFQYVNSSDGLCPFCQRPLVDEFINKLNKYFDETYLTNIQEIKNIYNRYTQTSEIILKQLETHIHNNTKFIDTIQFNNTYYVLKSIIDSNKQLLADKLKSPNKIIHLDPTKYTSDVLSELLSKANREITEYNNRISNIKEERDKARQKVWKYITNECKNDILNYQNRKKELEDAIQNIKYSILNITSEIKTTNDFICSLEKRLTSIVPTAEVINNVLKSYGITAFHLGIDDNKKNYHFIREDGTNAFCTMSEGERNLVTFLYFIFSLTGNTDESGHNFDKIVVIDDPVSSLDNDVLFLVSSLIRDLFDPIYNSQNSIKQLFILSHNIYFFKEVSYKQGLKKHLTGYWMITKSNNNSIIREYNNNPITSTYEMLWDVIRKAQENPNDIETATLANIMRRIIEHYFHLLGGFNLRDYHKNFPSGERQIFKSLISWANAGSHSAFDDYSATPNIYNVENYLKVFRDLFKHTNHIAHYNMMMKITTEEIKND